MCKAIIFDDLTLPEDFNHNFLCFLPKGEDIPGIDGSFTRSPAELRPLSLGNTDAKIVSKCILFCISDCLVEVLDSNQCGACHGQIMADNILKIETNSLCCSLSNEDSGLLCLDYSSAFPSIIPSFLWMVLLHVGLPAIWVRAIQRLYMDKKHSILH